jgi:hypothetical protein
MKHPDSVVAAIYRTPAIPLPDMFLRFKAGLRAAGDFMGGPFATPGFEEQFEADDESVIQPLLMLAHYKTEEVHNLNVLWGPIVRYHQSKAGYCALELETIARVPGTTGVQLCWDVNLHILRPCLESVEPDLAAMNGYQYSKLPLPRDREVGDPTSLPSLFSPWTFIGGMRLTEERRQRLLTLPAFRVEPFGTGIIVQAVEDLFSDPDPNFVIALREIPNPTPIKYLQVRPRITRS